MTCCNILLLPSVSLYYVSVWHSIIPNGVRLFLLLVTIYQTELTTWLTTNYWCWTYIRRFVLNSLNNCSVMEGPPIVVGDFASLTMCCTKISWYIYCQVCYWVLTVFTVVWFSVIWTLADCSLNQSLKRLLQLRFDFDSTIAITIKIAIRLRFDSSKWASMSMKAWIHARWHFTSGMCDQRRQSKDATWCSSVSVNAIVITVTYIITSLYAPTAAFWLATTPFDSVKKWTYLIFVIVESKSNRNFYNYVAVEPKPNCSRFAIVIAA